mgnify:CR=1 FL=1
MSEKELNILIVDDNAIDREVYQRYLAKEIQPEPIFIEAETGEEALESYAKNRIDIILLDYNLPDLDGLELLDSLPKKHDQLAIPIILLTGQGNENIAVEAMRKGAYDYLVKHELSKERLSSAVHKVLREHKSEMDLAEHHAFLRVLLTTIPNPIFYKDTQGVFQDCNQAFLQMFAVSREEVIGQTVFDFLPTDLATYFYNQEQKLFQKDKAQEFECAIHIANRSKVEVIFNIAAYRNQLGEVKGLVGVITDITERKRYEETIEYLAMYDQLTDLPNRSLFFERLDRAMARSKRESKPLALLYIDLNGFKKINDQYGHNTGDIVLKDIAKRLKILVRKADTACRMGGDEFAMLLEGLEDSSDVELVAQRIVNSVSQPVVVHSELNCQVGVSIGISIYPNDSEKMEELIMKADQSMYKAKSTEGIDYCFYNQCMSIEKG